MIVIRWIIGRIILFFDFIFSPKKPQLTPEQQQVLNQQTQGLSLYQLPACPFCVKVRRAMKRNGIVLPLKNINQSTQANTELVELGGKRKVPCLRIETGDNGVKWLYESSDIVAYLDKLAVAAK